MRILLAGCGKMGGAMLARWQAEKLADEWVVIDPGMTEPPSGITAFASLNDLPEDKNPDIIIFAVKPQTLPSIIGDYQRFADKALFISIAAGTPISFFQQHLGTDAAIIRAMPNTPAFIGKGMTVACATASASKETATKLFEAIGLLQWIDDEKLMNPVTALSGSGPAYIFLLIETLEKSGIALGLPPEMAAILARQTVIGSAALAEADSSSAALLRQNVTSPGGTTAAALSVLMAEPGMQDLFNRALDAATKRAEELSRS